MNIGLIVDLLIQLLVGIGVGFATGMTGIGAAVLVVPTLIYAIGLSPVSAVGTGLLYSMLTRAYASFEHLRLLTIRKRTFLYISLSSVPSVLVTSLIIIQLGKNDSDRFNFILKVIICTAMLITWMLMFVSLIKNRKSGTEKYYVPPKHFPLRRKLYSIVAGAGIGALVGSTSIGGGILLIPVLSTIFQFSPYDTVGTSTVVSVVMSAVGSFIYLLGGSVNLSVALIMFVGSVPGVWLGSRLAVKTPHRILSFILFVVVTLSIIIMFAGIIWH